MRVRTCAWAGREITAAVGFVLVREQAYRHLIPNKNRLAVGLVVLLSSRQAATLTLAPATFHPATQPLNEISRPRDDSIDQRCNNLAPYPNQTAISRFVSHYRGQFSFNSLEINVDEAEADSHESNCFRSAQQYRAQRNAMQRDERIQYLHLSHAAVVNKSAPEMKYLSTATAPYTSTVHSYSSPHSCLTHFRTTRMFIKTHIITTY